MRFKSSIMGPLLMLLSAPSVQAAAAINCESLATLKLHHAAVVSAKSVPAGPTSMTSFTGAVTLDVPSRCEVRGISRPSSDSEIAFELWLPLSGWNGKYEQVGNGGFAGSINRTALVNPLRRGFAVAATDDGHNAVQTPQGTFALGHPEKLIDFSYRAVHDTSEQAKVIVAAFYGTAPAPNYFVGCSDGGREALMEAQRYPEDFDGILAGAPANDWSHLFTSFAWNALALSKTRIPIVKLATIQRAVLAACDAADGLKDGLVSNPMACHFDPAVLACKNTSEERNECLTAAEIGTLKALYSGPKDPHSGAQLFPGLVRAGTEALPISWPLWVVGMGPGQSAQAGFGLSYFRDVVREQPNWQLHSMDFDRDVRLSDEKVAPIINATNPDLRSFRAHGGKLLQYHGWADAAIAAPSSIQYYEAVRSFLDTYPDPRSRSKSVEDFYRLFLIPGMGHCGQGVGPVNFGNDALASGTMPASGDAQHDVFTALTRWVEQGMAPDQLVGTGPSPLDPTRRLSRPLCPYPQQAIYTGNGDVNEARNFECRARSD